MEHSLASHPNSTNSRSTSFQGAPGAVSSSAAPGNGARTELLDAANAPDSVRCGLSHYFHNKENRAPYRRLCKQHTEMARRADPNAPDVYDTCWAFSRFKAETLSPVGFDEHILNGGAWTPSIFGGNGRRTNENWQQAELIAVDYDDNVSVADCLKNPFVRRYALLVHPSPRSGKPGVDGRPIYRTRVIFRLDAPITGDFENYRLAARAICQYLGLNADRASFKPAQLYYGSTNRIEAPVINHAARLPIAIVNDLIAPLLAEAERRRAETERQRAERRYVATDRNSQAATREINRRLDSAYQKVAGEVFDRTTAAYGQSRKLAKCLAYWSITEQDIERTIIAGARANGSLDKYGEVELLRAIHNGIRDGQNDIPEPCELPTRPHHSVRRNADRQDSAAKKSGEKQQTSPYFHSEGDPRSWVIALRQSRRRSDNLIATVRLLWAAYRTQLLDPCDFTKKQLFSARDALGMNLKDGTLNDNFNALEGLFWRMNTDLQDVFISQKNPQGGRPEAHYCALPLVETVHLLPQFAAPRLEEQWYTGMDITPPITPKMADSLEGDARRAAYEVMPLLPPASEDAKRAGRNARQDTSALARSLKDLTPVNIPLDCEDVAGALFAQENDPDEAQGYRDIMRKYGVAVGGVKPFVERNGLRVVKQTVDCAIKSAATFVQELTDARKEHRGYPIALIERKASGDAVEHPYSPTHAKANLEVIETAQQAGNTIELRLRTKSKYVPGDQAKPHRDETPRTSPPRTRRAPASIARPYFGMGYNPDLVLRWLKTHLRNLGWKERPDGYWIDPDGVKYDLLSATPERDQQALLTFAERELGAVITRLA